MLISRRSILLVFILIIFSFLYRVILPLGDEPDFFVRTAEIISTENHIFPYILLGDSISNMSVDNSLCEVNIPPLSLVESVSLNCLERWSQVVYRVAVFVLALSPLIIVILIRPGKRNNEDFNERSDVISLALLLPSSIYYMGLISIEQFYSVVSFMVYLFWKNKTMLFFIAVGLFLIDSGNAIVLFAFMLYAKIVLYLWRRRRGMALCFMLASTLLAIVLNRQLLHVLSLIPLISSKVELIILSYELKDNLEKYPAILRVIITYMSFIFYSADNVKAPVSYLVMAFFIIIGCFRFYVISSNGEKKTTETIESFILVLVCFSFIVTMVSILPTYANAKYYLFMLPFFLSFFYKLYGFERVLLSVLLLTTLTWFQIATIYVW